MNCRLQHKIITSIVKQYETDGHSPYLTFTDNIEQFVLKTPNSLIDNESLIKEFLCSFLLSSWDINTPEVAVLSLKPELYQSQTILNDKRFSYSNYYFGSNHIDSAIELQDFITGKDKNSLNRVNNIETFYMIALFDIWVENDDRKPSNNNLLLRPVGAQYELSPIDHALTFASMPIADLNPDFVSFSDNDSILLAPLGHSIIKNEKIDSIWLKEITKKFYICITKSQKSFQHICNTLPNDFKLKVNQQQKLYNFLFNQDRNKKVFEQFCYILNSIK